MLKFREVTGTRPQLSAKPEGVSRSTATPDPLLTTSSKGLCSSQHQQPILFSPNLSQKKVMACTFSICIINLFPMPAFCLLLSLQQNRRFSPFPSHLCYSSHWQGSRCQSEFLAFTNTEDSLWLFIQLLFLPGIIKGSGPHLFLYFARKWLLPKWSLRYTTLLQGWRKHILGSWTNSPDYKVDREKEWRK